MPKRPASRRPPRQVFVSHATADKGIVLLLCEKIDAIRGAITFRDDRDISGGAVIPDKLLDAPETSDEMLVLLTPSSLQSTWVMHEIGAVWTLRKLIVPVFHSVDPSQFPPLVKDVKAYRLQEFDQYLADLRGRARGPIASANSTAAGRSTCSWHTTRSTTHSLRPSSTASRMTACRRSQRT